MDIDTLTGKNDFNDPALRDWDPFSSLEALEKVTFVTFYPQNEEFGQYCKNDIRGNTFPEEQSSVKHFLNYSSFNINKTVTDNLRVDPIYAWKDNNNNLVLLSRISNESPSKVSLEAIDYVQLTQGGNVIAEGESGDFDQPMILSSKDTTKKVNLGVTDGYPNQCFLVTKFTPGSYDPSIDVGDMGQIVMTYSVEYTNIDE